MGQALAYLALSRAMTRLCRIAADLAGQCLKTAAELAGKFLRIAADVIGKWLTQLRTCRMCGNRVRPTDDICPSCGAAGPVMVPVSTALLVTCLAGAACLLTVVWLA